MSLIMNEVCVGCGAAACGGLELEAPVTAVENFIFTGFASVTHCLAGDGAGEDDESDSCALRGENSLGEQLGEWLWCRCCCWWSGRFCSVSISLAGLTPR